MLGYAMFVTIGYANYGAFVILGDLITLGWAMFHDFVAVCYVHLKMIPGPYRTLESLFALFVLFHVRHHRM